MLLKEGIRRAFLESIIEEIDDNQENSLEGLKYKDVNLFARSKRVLLYSDVESVLGKYNQNER